MSNFINGSYGLKYYAEWRNQRGQDFRLEVKRRGFTGNAKIMGHFQGCALEIQGDQGNVTAPIVKTQLRFTLIDSWDEADTSTTKYGGWEEFYTPDSTLYLVILKSWTGSAWFTRWSGYITPDSWSENLDYRGSITVTVRDNIGHLQDFPFDMTGDAWGLVSLRSIITGAASKVNLPLDLQFENGNLPAIDGNGTAILDAKVCVSTFENDNWERVLEDVLDSIGYTIRWTDNNRVTVCAIRHLPLVGTDGSGAPLTNPVEFYNGSRRLDPAFKQIVDTMQYDGDNTADLDVHAGLNFSGTRQDYTIQYQATGVVAFNTGWSYQNAGTSDGYGWQSGYGFLDGDDTDLSIGMIQEEGEDAAKIGAILCANQSGSGFVQTYKARVLSPASTLRVDFAALVRGLRPTGETDNMISPLHVTLSSVRVYISYEVGNNVRYWNGNAWVSSFVYIDRSMDGDAENGYSIEFTLGPCDLADGGNLYISFDRIVSGALTVDDTPARGIYARVLGISLSSNAPRLESDKVTTINDSDFNVTMDRKPVVGALSREVPIVSPANYPNALYHVKNGVLLAFPYGVNWGQGTAEKPLPVMIHQQLLMFHHLTLSVLDGDCAPVNKTMPGFDAIWTYKNKSFLLQSGTWDMGTGVIQGAVLREYIEYNDLWDDTSSSWDGDNQSKYDTDAYKNRPTSQPSSGGGGGGGGSVNAVKVNGSTYNPNSSGLVTLPNYPTMLRNPGALILAETVNGTPVKTYNGESEVTFTKADLQAVLGGGGGGSGTVTSVGMTVPTGLSVSGSPITSSGTLQVSYSSGYSIPKTTDTSKGVTAYGWGNHANAGYLKLDDIESYLAGITVPPVIQIVSGYGSDSEPLSPYLEAFHPLVGDSNIDAEFVLMVWSQRRGRRPSSSAEKSKYRRGWGEARGNSHNASPITFGVYHFNNRGRLNLRSLQMHILHTYLCGRGQSLATVHSMNWQTFSQGGQDGYDYGFGALDNFSGTRADFYKKTSRHRMFGIAVRVENPAFEALVSGSLDETTRSIGGTPRYFYSAVTPFNAMINRDRLEKNTIGFQLMPINAPNKP